MNRKRISIVLAGLLIGGFSVATYLAAEPPPKQPADPPVKQPVVTLVYPKEPADSLFWPRENCWLFSVNRLDPATKGKQLSLVVRVKSVPLEIGKAPPNSISKAEGDREIKLDQVVQNNVTVHGQILMGSGWPGPLAARSVTQFARLASCDRTGSVLPWHWLAC